MNGFVKIRLELTFVDFERAHTAISHINCVFPCLDPSNLLTKIIFLLDKTGILLAPYKTDVYVLEYECLIVK